MPHPRRILPLLAVAALACSEAESGAAPASGDADRPAATAAAADAALAVQGERTYRINCIACHHMDPSQEGALGPAIAGSSLELLRAKVIRNEYPPGYRPKRETQAMVPLPYLERDLPALAAYLAQAAR